MNHLGCATAKQRCWVRVQLGCLVSEGYLPGNTLPCTEHNCPCTDDAHAEQHESSQCHCSLTFTMLHDV